MGRSMPGGARVRPGPGVPIKYRNGGPGTTEVARGAVPASASPWEGVGGGVGSHVGAAARAGACAARGSGDP
eukprot:scaffold3680_cov133-Isochrysis_galbana.AAC.5